ncbi:HNH endonuclease signature motif containing protein [Microbacterium oleivorans]|uniref:HNH endonuclease signature motif containing protein n=1 Tax=Microbacterium oleivorans TaxID=273677 RepID=UPI00203CE4CC|nr:HNH endonuclease signature motif containing protein [Microbacterium oleivorans]MCM3695516.1 HNH endonuclease [Microbacterium oleivorans]
MSSSPDARDEVPEGIPTALDWVVMCADMATVHAAQRYACIVELWDDAIADARRREEPVAFVERSVRLEVAAALRITEHAAGRLMGVGHALMRRYPQVWEAMSRAVITETHATIIVDGLDQVENVTAGLIHEVLSLAEEQSTGPFRRAVKRIVDREQEAALAQQHAAAVAYRHVRVDAGVDGMAWLTAHLPAVEAHAILGRITAIAKTLDDDRSLDQKRADVFGDLLIDGETESLPAKARGIRPTVTVTVPALTLLTGEGPAAQLDGIGPIPVEKARELCGAAAGWMRVLTHPETGVVLSVGRDTYRPPADLRRLVVWRAARCMAPGCGIPADRCDIDHTTDWHHGGTTAASNLAPLCRGHHTLKHQTDWQVRARPGGALEWTSPAGRVYLVHPERRIPTFTVDPPGPPPF